jgi:hypothetical protein
LHSIRRTASDAGNRRTKTSSAGLDIRFNLALESGLTRLQVHGSDFWMEVEMKPVLSERKTWRDAMQLDAPPARVFPLLCPVREYEWIEDWRCEVLHTQSGVAEEGCIFRTRLKTGGEMTWIVSRYEAPWRIEFACFAPGSHTMRLKLELRARDAGTTLLWTREITSTDPVGEVWVAEQSSAEHQSNIWKLERMLKHHLTTGTMLHITPAAVQSVQ